MNTTLWQLSEDLIALDLLISNIREAEGIANEEKEQHIELAMQEWLGSDQEFDYKATKVAAYIKYLESLAEARKQEYRRIQQLAQQAEKQAESMRSYLTNSMHRVGKQKISGVLANISLRKKPPRVVLGCQPEELPSEFQKVEVTARLNAIKDQLKSNPAWPFAELVEDGYSITIK